MSAHITSSLSSLAPSLVALLMVVVPCFLILQTADDQQPMTDNTANESANQTSDELTICLGDIHDMNSQYFVLDFFVYPYTRTVGMKIEDKVTLFSALSPSW